MADQQDQPQGDEERKDQAAGAGGAATATPGAPERDGQIPAEEPMVTPGMNWFVLRVASNKVRKIRTSSDDAPRVGHPLSRLSIRTRIDSFAST